VGEQPQIVVVGAGAIGMSLSGWISPNYGNLSLLAIGESLRVIKERGLKSYAKGKREVTVAMPLRAIGSMSEVESPDIVVISVKNYDLDSTSRDLKRQLCDHEPVVVALQNGVSNQQILPKYFARVVYGVVCYNAWRDAPGEVGHERQGYIILGTPANDLQDEMLEIKRIFDLGIRCVITDRLQDAAHCKLVVNLANPLMTLVGAERRPIESYGILAKMALALYKEGIELLQAAGFHEHSLGPVPSWRFLRLGARLPAFLLTPVLRLNAGRLGMNSMAQDVFGGRSNTELEELNGYMLGLARKTGFPTPINETVYDVARERFGPGFRPISETELWTRIKERVRAAKSGQNAIPRH